MGVTSSLPAWWPVMTDEEFGRRNCKGVRVW